MNWEGDILVCDTFLLWQMPLSRKSQSYWISVLENRIWDRPMTMAKRWKIKWEIHRRVSLKICILGWLLALLAQGKKKKSQKEMWQMSWGAYLTQINNRSWNNGGFKLLSIAERQNLVFWCSLVNKNHSSQENNRIQLLYIFHSAQYLLMINIYVLKNSITWTITRN
jgi:hypothetical protein